MSQLVAMSLESFRIVLIDLLAVNGLQQFSTDTLVCVTYRFETSLLLIRNKTLIETAQISGNNNILTPSV